MHPILIAGAALVGLPVVLHLLLKQEPKRLVFPALRFLKLKQKTSERKLKLRHLLLLLLRCLLIALFALALFQPTVLSTGVLDLAGEQPVAAVLIIDTSPSMGYKAGPATRLDDARRRALDFLDELPKDSRVAVLDPNDPAGGWEASVLDARRRIESLKEPAGFTPPLTTTLASAYQLLRTVDQEAGEQADPVPRLIAVFSDRTANCWDASRADELKKLRDAVPKPVPVHVFFDLGADKPTNVTILAADMRPQRLSGSADAAVSVVLRADGAEVPSAEVAAQLDAGERVTKDVRLPAGTPVTVPFKFDKLTPGFHTVTVSIREDNLAFDNTRTLTFEVAPRRRILTISDDPDTAFAWQLSHNEGKQEFTCEVVTPDRVPPDFDGYEAVTLLGVKAPSAELAKRLLDYVEAGGKVMLIPDGPGSDDARGKAWNDALGAILPASLGEIRTWELNKDLKRPRGVPWKLDDDRDLAHPLLAPLREFKRAGNVDIFDPARRRTAVKYRKVTPAPANAAVVAYFDDTDTAADRSPALVERTFGKGQVLLLATRFDFDASLDGPGFWNDYTKTDGHSWPIVLPWLLLRHLCGSPDDAAYNFPTGTDVPVPLPRFQPGQPRKVVVEGPGVLPRDATIEVGERQAELRITPPKTLSAGAFRVRAADEKNPWQYRFSLNTPAEESSLDKVPEEAIAEVFGPNAVAHVDREVKFRDLLETKFDRPVELFPMLMLLVLLFFALEGLVANRFYKLK